MKKQEGQTKPRRTMEKCGICGKDVSEQPTVTSEGTCNMCGTRLSMAPGR